MSEYSNLSKKRRLPSQHPLPILDAVLLFCNKNHQVREMKFLTFTPDRTKPSGRIVGGDVMVRAMLKDQ